MASETANRTNFESQARGSEKIGSPFMASLCRLLAERLDRSTAFGRRLLDWPGDPQADAMPLRACGALHALVRSGRDPALSAAYPPRPFDKEQLWTAIAAALPRHDSELTSFLNSPPQTNEVARSALLLGGMLHLARRVGLPLALYEIGASAGLNLGFDAYAYRLGEARWGNPDAPLIIECQWRGVTPPLDAPLEIASRAGCDLRPIDPANRTDTERLMSYIWADQAHRLERVSAALKLAAAEHRTVDKADAAEWVERHITTPQRDGTVRVLYHTIVWQYLTAETKTRIEATIAAAAASATPTRPVARIAIEADGGPDARIDLTIWPPGQTVTLGRGDFHGRSADWN